MLNALANQCPGFLARQPGRNYAFLGFRIWCLAVVRYNPSRLFHNGHDQTCHRQGFQWPGREARELFIIDLQPLFARDCQYYVVLANVVPEQNRRRGYAVSIDVYCRDTHGVSVTSSWGRLPNRSRALTRTFQRTEDAWKYVSKILARRRRHGYAVVEKSIAFPVSLADLPIAQRQLLLFE